MLASIVSVLFVLVLRVEVVEPPREGLERVLLSR
jgi:hypothetical protein